MDTSEKTYKAHISQVIEQQLQQGGIQNGDYKFYNVERLIRIAEKLDMYSDKCQNCKYYKNDLEDLAGNLHYYLNTSVKTRNEFEQRHDKLAKHLKKQHGVVTAGYHMHLMTFLGILAGALAGYLITFSYGGELLKIGLLMGGAVGLLIGRNAGIRKEVRKRKEGGIL